MRFPDFPGRLTPSVHPVQFLFVFEGVHATEESIVAVRHELLFLNQASKGLQHELLSVADITENLAPEHKIPAINSKIYLADGRDCAHRTIAVRRYDMV